MRPISTQPNSAHQNSAQSSTRLYENGDENARVVPSFRAAVRMIWWPFLLSRLWVFVFAYWGHFQYANKEGKYLVPFKGGWIGVSNWWLNPWTSYDSERFVHVAERGYEVVTSVSFPLYSWLLMPFRHSEIAMAAWGILLSNVAFLLALAMLYRLTQRDFNASIAKATIWATAFFPATVVFSAVYSESLFLLLVVLTFWNARSGSWAWAALFGLLAGLTRNPGPILCAALAIEYSMQRKTARDNEKKSENSHIAAWLAIAAPLLAFVGFQLYLRHNLGGNDLILRQQHALGRDWMFPLTPVAREIWSLVAHGYTDMTTLTNLWATLTGLFLIFAFWKRGVFSYTVFLGGVLLSFLAYGVTYAPFTVGAVRYLAAAFPMEQRLAMWALPLAQRQRTRWMLIACALAASGLIAFYFGRKDYLF